MFVIYAVRRRFRDNLDDVFFVESFSDLHSACRRRDALRVCYRDFVFFCHCDEVLNTGNLIGVKAYFPLFDSEVEK